MEGCSKKPGLFTAVGIGVGSMVGSGWLFSAYYAAQYIGPASFFSWAIGAGLSLILALLLAEIAGMFREKALFARLITVSHGNPDFGFIIAISGWLGLVLVIPTEASATIQYISTAIPSFTHYLNFKPTSYAPRNGYYYVFGISLYISQFLGNANIRKCK